MKALEGSPPTDDQLKKMMKMANSDSLFIFPFLFYNHTKNHIMTLLGL